MLKVRNLLWKNLEVWEDNPAGFEEDVYVAAYQSRYFRWHSAGDIPDEAYLHMIVRIAGRLPKTNFLCFTKRFEMINEYLSSAQGHSFPPNLQIILSAWGDFVPDNPFNLPIAYVRFKKEQTQIPASAFQCKKFCGECVLTDQSCWNLKRGESVVFDEH